MSGAQRGGGISATDRPLRLFIAIALPESWRTMLRDTQDRLRDAGLRLRFVRPENAHLTLKFLGEVEAGRLPSLTDALGAVPDRHRGFTLELGDLGTFGGARRPRVVWVGLRGDLPALSALHAALEAALVPLRFPRETGPFRAHITLARTPESLPAAEAARIAPVLAGLGRLTGEPLAVGEFALMQSDLGPGGPRYTALASWPLARPPR